MVAILYRMQEPLLTDPYAPWAAKLMVKARGLLTDIEDGELVEKISFVPPDPTRNEAGQEGLMTDDSPSPEAAAGEPPVPAADPIVVAARRMVAEVFRTSAARLPELLAAQSPPDTPIPQFTEAMIEQLQAQLTRALGLPPDEDGSAR